MVLRPIRRVFIEKEEVICAIVVEKLLVAAATENAHLSDHLSAVVFAPSVLDTVCNALQETILQRLQGLSLWPMYAL